MPRGYKPIQFPTDESVHDNAVEWWYFNGNLKDGSGNEYSFMDCLFRVEVKKVKIPFYYKVPFKIAYFSHSLVTDINDKKFYHRIAPFSVLADDSFSKPSLYINYLNPEIKNGYVNCAIEKIGAAKYHVKNEDIDLVMTSTKKPLLEGGNGYLDLGTKTTYYYSLTNLRTEGRIKIKDKWIDVSGKSWMDHQWADTEYTQDRWDWFSLQLDNETEMICCVYDNGQEKTYLADISYPDNKQEHALKVEIIPSEKRWRSPKSKAEYPLAWQIKIPERNIALNLTARLDNQEMLFGSINYWEGPLIVVGDFGGKKVTGLGFMELVGYHSQYTNAKYIGDEIGQTARHFVAAAKNRATDWTGGFKKKAAK